MSQRFGPAYAAATLSGAACALLPDRFRAASGRGAALDAARSRGLHPAVRAAIVEQNMPLRPNASARHRALAKLNATNLSCVVTGQQVGLFAGPLYAIWKAATAVVWAKRLEDECGSPVVPVFWLQTEDHDLEEIASATVVDPRAGVHTIRVDGERDARRSIAHCTFDDRVLPATARLRELLTGLPNAEAACNAIEAAYRPGRTWADAFAQVLARLFADTELLVLQPRTEELAALAMPVHRWALREANAIAAALTTRATALSDAGFAVQIPPRPTCSLSFFHPDGPAGPRYRLERGTDGWRLAGRDPADVGATLEAALRDEPMRWSSSALLRPLVQDTLLPTAAYVGGPGELSYWAQLPPLYAQFGLPVPLVIPRATGTFVDADTRAALHAIDRTPTTLPASMDALLEALGPPSDAPTFGELEARTRVAVADALADARTAASALDPTLDAAFDKTVEHAARGVAKLERRLHATALRSDEVRNTHARIALARVVPGGTPQDRALCVPDLAARVGLDGIVPPLLSAIHAADASVMSPLTVPV